MDEMKIKEEEEEEIIILLEILMNYTIDKSEFTDVTLTYKMCLAVSYTHLDVYKRQAYID